MGAEAFVTPASVTRTRRNLLTGKERAPRGAAETWMSRSVRHGRRRSARPSSWWVVIQLWSGSPRSSSSAAQRGSRPLLLSCSCGSTFRFLPQTGQRPLQSGAWRIWSGRASAIASRAQATARPGRRRRTRCGAPSRGGIAVVVLPGVDGQVDDGVLEAAHARPVQPYREPQAQHEAARRLRDDQLGGHLLRHGQVALAAEVERLELDRDRLAVLLAGAQPQPAEGKRVTSAERSACKSFVSRGVIGAARAPPDAGHPRGNSA